MGKGKVFLAVLLVCSSMLTACGHEQIASDKAISRAQLAVDAAEQYIEGTISAKDAYDKVSSLADELSYVDDWTANEIVTDKHKSADSHLEFRLTMLSFKLSTEKWNGTADSFDELKEDIQALKEDIKKYK